MPTTRNHVEPKSRWHLKLDGCYLDTKSQQRYYWSCKLQTYSQATAMRGDWGLELVPINPPVACAMQASRRRGGGLMTHCQRKCLIPRVRYRFTGSHIPLVLGDGFKVPACLVRCLQHARLQLATLVVQRTCSNDVDVWIPRRRRAVPYTSMLAVPNQKKSSHAKRPFCAGFKALHMSDVCRDQPVSSHTTTQHED